ncbi:MAG: hypothetical protein GWN58_40045 [Anaerolineae bacterium]|nr:hypothetical protein [Anaerolineae bacterium]
MSDEKEVLDPLGDQEEAQPEADIEAMQAELDDLRRQVAEVEEIKKGQRHRWRRIAVAVLILLGSLVIIIANLAFWMRGTILNTDRWVNTVGPLTQNEVIVDTLTGYVVIEVFEAVDIQGVAEEILPERVAFLSVPLTVALQDAVRDAVSTAIQSDEINAAWTAANRTVHRFVVGVLRGEGDVVYVRGGQLTLDLSDLFGSIISRVGLDRLERFEGEDIGKFVLLESRQVAAVQSALALLDGMSWLLLIVAVVLYFVAWLVSLWRNNTVFWIGAGLASAMALVLIVLAIAKPMVLAYIVDPVIRAFGGEIWGLVLRGLIVQTIMVGIVGLIIALVAWLAGPHSRAVAIRTGVRGWIGGTAE